MGETADPKKVLLPYLQRADELQKHEPLVAYYCRLFAMEAGLKIPVKERGKTINGLLVSLMSQLEKDKKVVKLSPDDNMYLEGFALSVFAKADKQDRAGRADLNTAKTFYAASIFFDILHQFGELPPDIEQKKRYATWKAADIRKALSEGRKPIAGPPAGDEQFSEMEQMTWDTEGSPQKSNISPAAVAPDVPPFQPGSPPSPTVSHQLPRSESIPRTSSIDSLPRPPSTAPFSHATQHTRTGSSDDIDLPSAPSQPIYPGVHNSSPPQYPSGFSTNYSSSQYPGQDTGAPPPPIHDWSGTRSHVAHGADRPGETPSSSPFNYPANSPDDYNSNSSNTSNYPSYSSHVPHHTPSVYGTEQGNNYSQYSAPPPPIISGFQPGAYPSAAPSQTAYPSAIPTHTAYPSAAPSHNSYTPAATTQNVNAGYSEPPKHHRTAGYTNVSYSSPSSYQPTPDKVAEAHKAARFAVSALAFDDVPTAIEYLRKSMELLTASSSHAH
ncbi:hypothetical protein Mapa_008873 [Marchantia paleacea]|nr:hypothetical protein Mapa_008873 [Marchantia paleacea]